MLLQGRFREAIDACENHLQRRPNETAALRVLGEAAARAGDRARSETVWRQVLASQPDDAEALFHLGSLARLRGQPQDAREWLEQARAQAPTHGAILNNLGLALESLGRLAEAEGRFREALASAPDAFEAGANLAQNLYQQKRFAEALPYFDSVVTRFTITNASIWANRSVCQLDVGDVEGAEASILAALALEKTSPTLYVDAGSIHLAHQRHAQALHAFEAAVALRPDYRFAQSNLLFCRQYFAQWQGIEDLMDQQLAAVREMERHPDASVSPFAFLTISDDPGLQRKAAESWMRNNVAVSTSAARVRRRDGPLNLGFVSFDFHEHPVGRLIVDLLERLDRKRFHVTLYALGRSPEDTIRRRLAAAARLHAIPGFNAEALAERIRADGIDVLFDLNGFTGRSLVNLFARRPAPLQVNFLGYTGTLGTTAYDRIIADRHCIPEEAAVHYAERPLYVEPCYLPSDTRRGAAPDTPDRAEYGLPGQGAVLCAFANTYKILPAMFNAWMELLSRHPAAVLWLRDAGTAVNDRLLDAARSRGVDGSRLAIAANEPIPRYLSRFRLADVFLDTAPYGAHTTVNDALYAGLPVLTIDGSSFAGRASASQVRAAGLDRMVAVDLADYLAIADRLLDEPEALAEVTAGLRAQVRASPLFDMEAYARRFGDAIAAAWEERVDKAHAHDA